ncbi:MAG TPA: 50S ribosomal protein L9 [Patescibacteria group bacterium]|nr:50S ribosomal protein L9 [Patescibacteria group bacterium]
MKVIILKTGEVKNVADGYARNYLIPQGLAQIATPEKIAQAEKVHAERQKETSAQDETWKRMSESLSNTTVVVSAESNEEGTLFGAVSLEDILVAINKQKNATIQAEWLKIAEPVKKLGTYSLSVEFPNKQKTVLMLDVQKK